MKYRRFGTILLAAFGMSGVRAQESQRDTEAFSDRLAGSGGPGSSLTSDPSGRSYAPSSPGDSDLGEQLLLMPAGKYQPLTLHGGAEGRWVSNAALTDGGELDDYYRHYGAGATFLPRIADRVYGEVAAGYEWYRYTDHSELDFDSLTARAGILGVLGGCGDLSVWTRYNYTRLADTGGDEIFTDHGIELGAFKPIPFGRDHFFYLSWSSEFSLDANPGFAGRDEHSLLTGYRYSPFDKLDLGLFYRFAVLDYDTAGRTDLNHYLGGAIDYRMTDHMRLRASVSYQLNDSNLAGADYESLSAGGTVGVRIQF